MITCIGLNRFLNLNQVLTQTTILEMPRFDLKVAKSAITSVTILLLFLSFSFTFILGTPDNLQLFQEYVHVTQDENCLPVSTVSNNKEHEASTMIAFVHFHDFIEINGTQDILIPQAPILMYFDLVGSEHLFQILKMEIISHLTTCLHNWMVMLQIPKSELKEFLMELHSILRSSRFFQGNPIFICIYDKNPSVDSEFYVGYRIDSVASPAVLKRVFGESFAASFDLSSQFTTISQEYCQNDMNGSELIILGVNDSYFDFDTKFGPDAKNPTLESCFVRDIVQALELTLNFKAKMEISPDWGYFDNRTNSWIGTVGSIMNNTADVAISSMSRTRDRQTAVDFNHPTQTISICALFKRINSYASSTNYPLLAPFTPGLWATIAIWCTMNYILYRTFMTVLGLAGDDKWLEPGDTSVPSSLGAICMQGVANPPRQTPLRILLLVELFGAVVLNAAYGATLVSFISVETISIKSMSDLVSGKYSFEFTMLWHPVTQSFLKYSADPDIQKLYQLIFPNGEDDLDYGQKGFVLSDEVSTFSRVGAGSLVYIADDLSSFKSIRKVLHQADACQIQEIKLPLANSPQGSAVKKNSGIRKAIDASILKMAESGNLVRWRNQHLSFRPRCNEENYSVSGADISDFSYPLQNLALMIVVSSVVLFVERRYYARFGTGFIL